MDYLCTTYDNVVARRGKDISDVVVTLRLTGDTLVQLEKAAQKTGVTRSEIMRYVLDSFALAMPDVAEFLAQHERLKRSVIVKAVKL